jgi:hypothetical protein
MPTQLRSVVVLYASCPPLALRYWFVFAVAGHDRHRPARHAFNRMGNAGALLINAILRAGRGQRSGGLWCHHRGRRDE